MNRHRYYGSPTIAYKFRTTFKAGSDYNILIISSDDKRAWQGMFWRQENEENGWKINTMIFSILG